MQKAPAATIDVLVKALARLLVKQIMRLKHIGTRHGEKLYERLCSREEMFVAQDQGELLSNPLR